MSDLLPCPFCGGPAVNVACEYVTCGLAEPMGERCIGKSIRAPVDDDDCALSKVWNTRPALIAERDALRGALAEAQKGIKLLEDLTACGSDDDYVLALKKIVEDALGSTTEAVATPRPERGGAA